MFVPDEEVFLVEGLAGPSWDWGNGPGFRFPVFPMPSGFEGFPAVLVIAFFELAKSEMDSVIGIVWLGGDGLFEALASACEVAEFGENEGVSIELGWIIGSQLKGLVGGGEALRPKAAAIGGET